MKRMLVWDLINALMKFVWHLMIILRSASEDISYVVKIKGLYKYFHVDHPSYKMLPAEIDALSLCKGKI